MHIVPANRKVSSAKRVELSDVILHSLSQTQDPEHSRVRCRVPVNMQEQLHGYTFPHMHIAAVALSKMALLAPEARRGGV